VADVRLAILGGGGFRVPLIYRALAHRPEIGIDEVTLYDDDPARLAVIAAVLAAAPGPAVRPASSLADAVRGSDVVFSAIRVGGADGRVRDERRALDAGILGQETVGAGGISYALRTLPVALRAAQVIRDVVPDAKAEVANWSPDATRIVYGDERGTSIVSVDGRSPVVIGGVADPSWSPDGSLIVGTYWPPDAHFVGVATMKPDGSDIHVLWHPEPNKDIFPQTPVWIADQS